MRDLLLAYIEGRRPTDVINELNRTLGTRYTIQRLGDWRRGTRPIPGIVYGYLLGLTDERRDSAD